jgi:LPXTG-motif cell wall-anchored protein
MKLFSAVAASLIILGLGSVGGGIAPALAQSYPPSGEPPAAPATSSTPATFTGTVVSHEGMTIVVKNDDGREMTFTHDSGLSLPWNLKPGDRVSVEYTTTSNGHQATGVTAAAPASASSSEENLPQTASPLPLLALIGTALLGTGAVIWYRASRAA